MLFEIVVAGFGGQGILFMGDTLSEAGMREGKHVTYLPTYGVAMRGGTANCVVTISEEEVGSPLLDQPHAAIIMNEPSLVKFQPMVRAHGLIVANSTLIRPETFHRADDVRIIWAPATQTAREVAGTERSANMVALGAFLGVQPIVGVDSIESVIREVAGAHKKALIEKNIAALRAGLTLVRGQGASS